MFKGNIEEVSSYINDLIKNPNLTGIGYGIHERETVNYGLESDVNLLYCLMHGIDTFNIQRSGGCIVAQPGDLSLIRIHNENDSFNIKLVRFLQDKLQMLGIKTTLDNNDIMIDGYKISGCTKRRLEDGRRYSAIHISQTVNLEHIKYICLKPMQKTPAGLAQWGISIDLIEIWILDFLKQNYPDEIK